MLEQQRLPSILAVQHRQRRQGGLGCILSGHHFGTGALEQDERIDSTNVSVYTGHTKTQPVVINGRLRCWQADFVSFVLG